MHDLTERWAIQTQRFSLPSSLGPELSRFWGNRTSVSHQPPSPFSQPITFSLSLYYCLVLSAIIGCLAAVGCWESLVFSVLWPPWMRPHFGSVNPGGLGLYKCFYFSSFFFLFMIIHYHPEKTLTLHACLLKGYLYFFLLIFLLYVESISEIFHCMLAKTHYRYCNHWLNLRNVTLGRQISWGVRSSSFVFLRCAFCSS